MENVTMNILYEEIKSVKKKLEYLEDILIPEEILTDDELKDMDKLRAEALEEHKKRQTIKVEDIRV